MGAAHRRAKGGKEKKNRGERELREEGGGLEVKKEK